MSHEKDVIILGGGLAGLTLAMQLKKQEPDLTITVLELRKEAAKEAAHKVGESTVELGTYYLREVLGLKNYMEEKHLHKHGLRFFFSPHVRESIEKRVEHGAKNELFVPSHQIDRGIFENDMVGFVKELGVDMQLGARVKNITISDNEGNHTVSYLQNDEMKEISAKWLIDASGRTNLIKRKLELQKESPHNINSVWFRVVGEIDIAEWSADESWKSRINSGLRRLGTVHFMGKGYWVWFIPLSSGNTSVGIVADPRFHDFTEYNTLDKAYEWLRKNEPLCALHLEDKKDTILDFKILKNYSYDSKQFYSTDKWGVVGEAGAFLDPFYSPGTDFISLSNSWVSDLIIRDHRGEDVYTRTMVYNKVHEQLFKNWIPIYLHKYELFDNAQVMCVKITWDFAVYWAIPTLMFSNKALTNLNVVKRLFTTENSFGERFGKLNKQVQDFYLDWGRMENKLFEESFVNPVGVDFIADFQRGIEHIHTSEDELIIQLEKNLSTLEQMATEIFRIVSHKMHKTPIDLAFDPYQMSLKSTKEELIEQSKLSSALTPNTEMAKSISSLWLEGNLQLN